MSCELVDVATTFESDLGLRDFFARPWIPATAKRAAATEVAQRSDLLNLTSDFLALLAERGVPTILGFVTNKVTNLSPPIDMMAEHEAGRAAAAAEVRGGVADVG